jgi:signal transduction histidine kinase
MKNNKVLCAIKDYGIGMNEEELAHIFDRFYRSTEARNTHHAGDGIGLAIVKRLADLQHLTISFESEPAKGTTATITFN